MDVKYIGGDEPWTLPFGDHFFSESQSSYSKSKLNRDDLESIGTRHGIEPFDTKTIQHQSSFVLDDSHRWMNNGVCFTDKQLSNDTTTIKSEFNDTHAHTFCYLCSIGAHEHPRSQPRDPSLRRKLVPYENPKALRPRSASVDRRSLPTSTDFVPYKFVVRTDSDPNAGTRAQVYLYISGELSDWKAIPLASRANSIGYGADGFPSGSSRTFCMKGPDFGTLKYLKVNLVGARSDQEWLLKEIEVTNLARSVTWLCQFNCWLPKAIEHVSHEVTSHDRPPKPIKLPPKEKHSVYVVEVFTGSRAFAGTDSIIHIRVNGSDDQTKKLALISRTSDLFEQNQLDTFLIVGRNLGQLLKLNLESDLSKKAPDWDLKHIVMWKILPNEKINSRTYFPCNQWINDKRKTIDIESDEYRVSDGKLKGPMIYYVSVKTGSKMGAGTDANVFLIMLGDSGRSIKHFIDNRGKNDFERNSTSNFSIMDIDIGRIKKIEIGHDNTGPGAGWYLETVTIRKKISNCREIGESFIRQTEEWSEILQDRISESSEKGLARDDRPASSRSILRSPTDSARSASQKRVSWNKEETENAKSSRKSHQVRWISSYQFVDEKLTYRAADASREDEYSTKKSVKISTNGDPDDEIYQFKADRWLADDENDKRLSVILTPESIKTEQRKTPVNRSSGEKRPDSVYRRASNMLPNE